MKKLNLIIGMVLLLIVFTTCKKEKKDETPTPTTQENIIPETFAVDVPDAVSSETLGKNSFSGDQLKGEDIYKQLRLFINVGEKAGEIVSMIIKGIKQHKINKPMNITYKSGEDGRNKSLVVIADAFYEGQKYDFRLTISDQDSAKGLQVFWNPKPVKGIAILNPINVNRTDKNTKDFFVKIDYSEADTLNYSKRMIVNVVGLLSGTDRFAMNKLKMFVGKKGNLLDIYGNSNHPKAWILDSNGYKGLNWAFVAHADDGINIGVSEVGLPPNNLNTTDSILTKYSIYNVLEKELKKAGITDSAAIANYLKEAKAPGYFVSPQGFVSAHPKIPANTGFTTSFRDLSKLLPYKPADVDALVVSFQ